MKKLLIPLLLLTACASAPTVCFDNTCVEVETAVTQKERSEGLMYRETLEENKGMLFLYDEEIISSFWMENTLIPLDIIWIDKNLTIVHIEHAEPCATQDCTPYKTPEPAKYVLETNINFTEENGIDTGDTVEITY